MSDFNEIALNLRRDAPVVDPDLARASDEGALADLVIADKDVALSLLAASPDCVKLLDVQGKLLFMSYGGTCAMEVDDVSAILGKSWWDLWPETERQRLVSAVDAAVRGKASEFAAFCPTAKSTPRWWAVTVSPVLGMDGEVAQVLAVSRNVTDLMIRQSELEAALKESEILRREVDHRVKNSLGLVSSMLNLKARSAGDARVAEALRDASMRVRTIASVHDRLYRAATDRVPLNDYVASLIADIQISLGGTVTLSCRGLVDDVTVAPDVSLALGLIVAELTGNALRHADLSAGGRIDVTLEARSDGWLCLSVRDTGKGLPKDFDIRRGGMGMTVVLSMADKIGATVSVNREVATGACFDVAFPVA